MIDIKLSVTGFIVCTIAIIFSGTKLTKYGDVIAEITGWGRAWIGLILMASVTSLPELMTGISSVVLIGAPNLAAGDVFGSCVFNLLILSFVDARIKQPLTSLVKPSHLFAGLSGIILLCLSAFGLLFKDVVPALFWVSPFSILIVLTYIAVMYGIFHYENRMDTAEYEASEKVKDKDGLRTALIYYSLNALLVIVAAAFLPHFGEKIADYYSMGDTFFGTLFLAASTSLPELVVSFAAIRLASYDLLVGNLLGSNIFNMLILALDDIFYTEGSLFSSIQTSHLQTIIFIIVMTAIVGLGILVRPTKKYWKFSLDTLIIALLYLCLMIILFLSK